MKFALLAWVALRFLAPDPMDGSRVVAYVGERGSAISWWQQFVPRPGPASTGTVTPGAPGSPQTVYASITENPLDPVGWRNGGAALRLWYVTDAGDTVGPSNYVMVGMAVPDSLFNDLCGDAWLDGTSPSGWQWSKPNPLKPTVRQVVYYRVPWDTLLAAPTRWPVEGKGSIVHMESILQALRVRNCLTFHRWALAGTWRECVE